VPRLGALQNAMKEKGRRMLCAGYVSRRIGKLGLVMGIGCSLPKGIIVGF
jgi:hypothetical protein